MKLNRDSREYAYLDVTADVDLTPTTVTVTVGNTEPGAWSWVGDAEQDGATWKRTARRLVAGPDAIPSSALVLPLGRSLVSWRLGGIDPESPVRRAEPIDVE